MQSGQSGAVVGGSLDFEAARNFGTVVYEIQLPREVLYDPPTDGVHDLEVESFVPFAIHHSWITRVLAEDGTVLFDFSKEPAQQVSDTEVDRLSARRFQLV